MKCCSYCFESSEVKFHINASGTPEKCDFCQREGINCVESRELETFFSGLLERYAVSEDAAALPIDERIYKDFPGGAFARRDQIKPLLAAIFADSLETYSPYIDGNVIHRWALDDDAQSEVSAMEMEWESFSHEIKTENRFHVTNALNLGRLGTLLKALNSGIANGTSFYRARISNEAGYECDQMWNPPVDSVVPGRANPAGISYLYLADAVKTAVYEARAGLYDFISIAEFRCLTDLNIVDLRNFERVDPLRLSATGVLEDYLRYKPILERLGFELSKPKRPIESDLDYIPTQYLAEFIKSLKYEGIGYASSQCSGGHNFAFFKPKEKFECVSVTVYEVRDINLTYQPG